MERLDAKRGSSSNQIGKNWNFFHLIINFPIFLRGLWMLNFNNYLYSRRHEVDSGVVPFAEGVFLYLWRTRNDSQIILGPFHGGTGHCDRALYEETKHVVRKHATWSKGD